MVAHLTLRTYDVNKVFFRKNIRVLWLFLCNQMPWTNRKAWFTPCVRIGKWATIYYKNHGSRQGEGEERQEDPEGHGEVGQDAQPEEQNANQSGTVSFMGKDLDPVGYDDFLPTGSYP